MTIAYQSYDEKTVANLRAGGADAYGHAPERVISAGSGTPCRCCLNNVPKGAEMLICAARPFPNLHPYAETGPIFLCADDCTPFSGNMTPPILRNSSQFLLKGYCADHRIIYGTGQITKASAVAQYAKDLFDRPEVAFVDIRSASNNCFLTRIIRGI
ncbi:DUF1203 domain-containing protein [Yoonia sp. I 8.24]|uniref:DUF1203 domain-containing protein n=1 Tax=Yoonia sp. I 8.24 TaxID=1537229 RepID=UPI001EDD3CC6|nr:DUF1203 domain-containing protein [Yoonia sp. I 8.24]MCG3267439.1 DUF1203 domain-containing protein [Yoonia sp. I 8.24]